MKDLRENEQRMTRRSTRIVRKLLMPPRELRFAGGKITWKPPQDTEGITHYRVYADDEYNLVREIPFGQEELHDNLSAERVFISSYSRPLDQESVRDALLVNIHPVNKDSVEAYGASPTAKIVFDGAISGNVFTSATADLIGREGQLLWIEGAGAGGLDLLTYIQSVTGGTSCITAAPASTPVTGAEARFGPDSTAALTAAHNKSLTVGAAKLLYERGIYLTTASLPLNDYLTLIGDSWAYESWTAGPPTIIACCVDVPVMQFVDDEEGTKSWISGNISSISFRGTKRSGSRGIYSTRTTGAFIEKCAFDHFGDEAIALKGGVFGNHVVACSATGSCLVRERTDYVGVFYFEPTDLFIRDCEVGASFPHGFGGEFGDGKIAAFAFRGADNSFVSNCMGHHSQIGFFVGPIESGLHGDNTTFLNCRSDHNQGHGWLIGGNDCVFNSCRSYADGQDADGLYDGFQVSGGANEFIACSARNYYYAGHPSEPPTLYDRYRNAFRTTTPGSLSGNKFFGCVGVKESCTGEVYEFAGEQQLHPVFFQGERQFGSETKRGANVSLGALHAEPLVIPSIGDDVPVNGHDWHWRTLHGEDFNALILAASNDAGSSENLVFNIGRKVTSGHEDEIDHIYISAPDIYMQGASTFQGVTIFTQPLQFSTVNKLFWGTGDPNGTLVANGGSLFLDGGGGLWVKTAGTGSTGWTSVAGLVDLAAGVSGVLPIANGGTGENSATAARGSLDVYSKAEVDAAIAAAIAAIDTSTFVTKTQHNAHDHQYDPTGTNPLSHTGSANPVL